MSYRIVFTKQAKKDLEKVQASTLKGKALQLLKLLQESPLQPPLEKLAGLEATYSKRINLQHRLVYQIFEEERTVQILCMWTHYGDN